jgi:mono/diheme cytochrome c family protein
MDAWKDEGYSTVASSVPKKKGGEELYAANCLSCHQADGRGLKGEFPPLAGNLLVQADDPRPAIKVVLDGMSDAPIQGVEYKAIMPGFRETLSDKEVAEVLTYVRNEWGNHASRVSTRTVERYR